ncbi:hypothetical protein SLEP1_g52520 [Rubroshorea leprosula]|uniref:Uncharacterized protein n=1 Tax=Rubroshorea leprosula TaxID=152421 RepID=A0AAV5M6J0_9ROSI|nr:hypothetical protein SLEP1_g52520 [Rubroshorea leprosula]
MLIRGVGRAAEDLYRSCGAFEKRCRDKNKDEATDLFDHIDQKLAVGDDPHLFCKVSAFSGFSAYNVNEWLFPKRTPTLLVDSIKHTKRINSSSRNVKQTVFYLSKTLRYAPILR